MGRHGRSLSFHDIDCEQASGILSDVLKEADAFLGGSSIGKGLKKAAMFYMSGRSAKNALHLSLPGAKDLSLHDDDQTPTEEAFYIVDLGVVVSQVYQCKFPDGIGGWNRQSYKPCSHQHRFTSSTGRRFFPRIEPFYAVKCNPDPVIVKVSPEMTCTFKAGILKTRTLNP
jgi:hypothetical protein